MKSSADLHRLGFAVRAGLALGLLVALATGTVRSQVDAPKPIVAPVPATVKPVGPATPAMAAPFALTAAQQALLQGKLGAYVVQLASSPGLLMVPIPAGTFLMGSPADEKGRTEEEGPQTRVTLTQPFFIGATSVTQAQWKTVMGNNPSDFKDDKKPVDEVDWLDALAFCTKLNLREQTAGRLPAGYAFTLPTEAQWEYACRAGTTGPYAGDLDALAWYTKNSEGVAHAVGTKRPNAWGLFDMQGNMWEWCLDWSGPYPGGSVTDPTGPLSGTYHVDRGGAWGSTAEYCRSAARGKVAESTHGGFISFRVVLAPAAAPDVPPGPVKTPAKGGTPAPRR